MLHLYLCSTGSVSRANSNYESDVQTTLIITKVDESINPISQLHTANRDFLKQIKYKKTDRNEVTKRVQYIQITLPINLLRYLNKFYRYWTPIFLQIISLEVDERQDLPAVAVIILRVWWWYCQEALCNKFILNLLSKNKSNII